MSTRPRVRVHKPPRARRRAWVRGAGPRRRGQGGGARHETGIPCRAATIVEWEYVVLTRRVQL